MKTSLVRFFALIVLNSAAQQSAPPNLVVENIPEVPTELKEQMNQYQNTRTAALLDWHPVKDQMLLSTRFGETTQLHILSQPLGARTQITFFKEPVFSGQYCPAPDFPGLLYTKDIGGNEFSQLYWYDEKNGKHTLLTDGGQSQNGGATWSNRGDQFMYVSTKRNKKDYDLYLVNMSKPRDSKLVLEVNGSWSVLDWSPDDKRIVIKQNISINSSKIHILDLLTGKTEEINRSEELIAYNSAVWSADGKGLFIVNDEGAEFQTLKYYDLTLKKFQTLTDDIQGDIHALRIDQNRKQIIFAVNEKGYDLIYELNTKTKKPVKINNLPKGVLTSFQIHPDGSRFGFSVSTPQIPGDIYAYTFKSKKLTRYTENETGGLNSREFADAQLIQFETFDKDGADIRKIPAFIYKPQNKDGKKFAVLINIHGGPEGQSRPLFNPFITFLNNELGVCVIQPNVRGSTGYGKTYVKLDNGFKREESVQDIGKLLEWVATQPDLDASRVAVLGGSYGGYMTLASMTHFNDKLRCGIDVVGISNFVTFLKNTEDYRKDLRRVEYGDERIPEMSQFLEKISPSNNVDKITKPMLIVQGANDPRVPMSEAEQIKKKLQEKRVETWYMLAKDEGHGFRKKANVDFYQWSVVLFLKRYLLE